MAEVGRLVGRFEILREVGRGGMAIVYQARQVDLDREVALKELPSFHASDPTSAARFLRESRILGRMAHPNVVTVHDYFVHDGIPYIAMEYMQRGSLRPLMRRLTLAQIVGVLRAVLAGLAYGHARGIVHRDLKPENLMISADGSIKLADFGIAKTYDIDATGRVLTATGSTVGTPAYMAPEQAMGSEITAATDLYAVGVIAYELLLGRLPFGTNDTTPVAVLLRHVNESPPAPLSINPDLDPRLGAWIEWLLAKAPIDRPAGAGEAWDELEDIVISLLGPRWLRSAALPAEGEAPPAPPLPESTPFPTPAPVPAAPQAQVDPDTTPPWSTRAPRPRWR
jgi:serine/threonine protein kinase